MIQYLLIFALGFFASALLALLVAPAIRRRVVTLTERRMRATVALTAAEVRAGKDAARARYAAENSRLSELLKQERDRSGTAAIERERLAMDLARSREAQLDLDRRIRELSETGDALNAKLRRQGDRSGELEAALAAAHHLGGTKDRYIDDLTARAEHLAGNLEQAQADIAARDSHAEMLRGRIEKLQEERTGLRAELKAATEASRELGIRLESEQARAGSLDGKLAARIAELSDREGALGRSLEAAEELARRLTEETERLSAATAALEARDREIVDLERQIAEQSEALRRAEARNNELEQVLERRQHEASRDGQDDPAPVRPLHEKGRTMNGRSIENTAISRRMERLRKRHAQLVGSLSHPEDGKDDAQLRDEIAEIAAMMVDLTAAREGPSSPIHRILAAPPSEYDANGHPSLADRSRRHMQASADSE